MRASLFSCALALSVYTSYSLADSFDQNMGKLLSLGDHSKVAVSAEMTSVSTGKVLYSLNAQNALAPASTTKLLLSTALLSKLSPSFRMQTRFYRSAPLINGVVNGDLIVVGDGDPFLVSEELFLIASQMRSLGYKEFTGDLVIDNSLFAKEPYVNEQKKTGECASRAYDAPVSAFGVNFNSMSILVSPTKNGDLAIASLEPFPLKGVSIKNQIRTVPKGPNKVTFECTSSENASWDIRLSGQIASSSQLQRIYRTLPYSEALNGEYIRSFLSNLGIHIKGKLREGKRDSQSHLIFAHESKPIAELVKGLCQFSNNYMADVMLKRLAVEMGHPGSFAGGVSVLRDFLSSIGNQDPFVLKDGSGLSYQTRLSAGQLNKILIYAARDFRIFPDFLASLPTGGESGTLKGRFHTNGTDELRGGNLRAKTGSLSEPVSVSALAGYFQHPSYGLVSFAIIQNGLVGKAQPRLLDLQQSQENALAFFGKNKGTTHGL